jgi:hypothetical protein
VVKPIDDLNLRAILLLCALFATLFLCEVNATGVTLTGETKRPHRAMASADIVVAADGSGDVLTVQEAIDRVPANNTWNHVILNQARNLQAADQNSVQQTFHHLVGPGRCTNGSDFQPIQLASRFDVKFFFNIRCWKRFSR